MALSTRKLVGIGGIVALALNAAACSSDSRPAGVGNGNAGAGTGASANGGDGSLNLGGNGSGNNNGNGGNGNGTGIDDACAADVKTAELLPLDMYIMLDTSSSMLDLTSAGGSKWDAVKAALEAFLKDPESTGIGVGLQYFPLVKPNAPSSCTSDAQCGDSGPCLLKWCYGAINIASVPCQGASDCVINGSSYGPCVPIATCSKNDEYVCPTIGAKCQATGVTEDLGTCTAIPDSVCLHTASCDKAAYAAPAAAIAALPDAAAGLVTSIDAQMPAGNTPTGPALAGAVAQAAEWSSAHPTHRVVAVLATDGLPTECPPTAIDSVSAIANTAAKASPAINTFVIGVFGPSDVALDAPDNLNRIAEQGGTKEAFIVDTTKDVTAQFLNALDLIRGARLACEFEIPQPTANETLDFGQVNVQFTTAGSTKTTVPYVTSASNCSTGGWYYDVDPSKGTPGKIIACPTTCTTFQASGTGSSVGIALGCATIVK